MTSNNVRKRGGTFHSDHSLNDDDNNNKPEFITPYYNENLTPEPLILTKLCLDDDDLYNDDEDDDEPDVDLDAMTRGRSRSRSVHENDLNNSEYIINHEKDINEEIGNNVNEVNSNQNYKESNDKDNMIDKRRGGPLQQREVLALKKGLEEANQPLNPNQSREDEEERMAADAEKRKRLLLSSNSTRGLSGKDYGTLSNDSVHRRVKILMLGDSGVGKSSLILRWTLDTFSPSLTSTVGVNFKSRRLTIANELTQVQVWDTAGQEHFHKITTSYYKGAQGILLVYDVTDKKTLENVEYWIKNIKSHASDTVQVALIGNKTDLRSQYLDNNIDVIPIEQHQQYCDTERGEEVAIKFGIPFFETSAKDSMNVDNAFQTLVEQIIECSIINLTSRSPSISSSNGVTMNSSNNIGLDRKFISDKNDKKLNNNFNKDKRSSFPLANKQQQQQQSVSKNNMNGNGI